jgi:uncharacterized protein
VFTHNAPSIVIKTPPMNATERDQLQQFLSALRQTRADPKDATADGLIREAVRAQADAPYLLVQRAMGLNLALDAAQTRIAQLEAQCTAQRDQLAQLKRNPPAPATETAAKGSWMSSAQDWGRGAETPAQHMPAKTPAVSAWGGGMMAQMATTAAGVVAGGLLFQGVQSLMGQHKPTADSNAASPSSNATDEALPGLVSPQASADGADDFSWDAGEDWA